MASLETDPRFLLTLTRIYARTAVFRPNPTQPHESMVLSVRLDRIYAQTVSARIYKVTP